MHYICTGGCEGVSDKEGTCQAETCPKHGQPLTPCDCTDGKHYGRQDRDQAENRS
jgi:hypothetical protein